MCYTAPIVLLALAYVYGTFIKVIFRDDDNRISESCVIGTFFVLILWEAIVLICDNVSLVQNEFQVATRIFSGILLIIFIVAIKPVYKRLRKIICIEKSIEMLPVIIVMSIMLVEFAAFFIFHPDIRGDLSVEAVNTITLNNNFFDYEYATGKPLVMSMKLKDKFNVLPLFYSYIKSIYNESASIIVYRCIPMWILSLTFMTYGLWAEMFFGNDERKSLRKAIFIVGLGAINLCGSFSENSIFYYQTMKGFSPITFCYTIILPFTVYELFCLYSSGRYKSLIYVVMAGVTSLAVLSYVNGLIPFAISFLICTMIAIGYKVRRKMKWRK